MTCRLKKVINYGINPSVEIQNSLWYQGIERIINKKMLQISGVYRNPMTGKIAYKQQSAEDLSSLPIGVKSRIKDFLFSQKHKKIIKRRKRSKNK